MDDNNEFYRTVDQLRSTAPTSSWLESALLSVGNLHLVHHEYDQALDAYRELQERFPKGSKASFAHWKTACPGDEESAGVNRSKRSPKGNRQMRRILNQAANAAVKHKGSIFEIVYRRLVLRLGHNKTIGAIANRLCELIWIILHKGVRYEERGPSVCEKAKRARTSRMIRTLRTLGYRVEPALIPA